MTIRSKIWLGTLDTRACASCGKRVSVSWASPILIALSIFVSGLIANRAPALSISFAIIVAGGIIGLLLHAFVVPLVERDT